MNTNEEKWTVVHEEKLFACCSSLFQDCGLTDDDSSL